MGTVTSADGTSIAFDRQGAGPPVILLYGGPGDRTSLAPLAALLAPHVTVFTYDRRGRGESGDTAPYSVEREFEDLAAVIAEAGGEAALFGSSGAGIIALEAAARGLPVTKVVAWEPPYIVDDGRPPVPPDWGGRVEELIAAGRPGDAIEYWLTEVVDVPKEYVTPMRETPFWAGMEAVAHGLVYDAKILGDFSLPAARLAVNKAPTLILDGGGAALPWLQAGVRKAVDAMPNARYEALEGQSHDVSNDVIAPVLAAFFTEET
jgi:pimeloyl-ACP methyl ester carboxylesterase